MQLFNDGGFFDELAVKPKRRPTKVKLVLHILSKSSVFSISTFPKHC